MQDLKQYIKEALYESCGRKRVDEQDERPEDNTDNEQPKKKCICITPDALEKIVKCAFDADDYDEVEEFLGKFEPSERVIDRDVLKSMCDEHEHDDDDDDDGDDDTSDEQEDEDLDECDGKCTDK